jgi:hypothetical protein
VSFFCVEIAQDFPVLGKLFAMRIASTRCFPANLLYRIHVEPHLFVRIMITDAIPKLEHTLDLILGLAM